ncbi:hypothetical protein EFS54_08625 [Periweissella beninensis]|uniref:Ribosomal protein L7/L12 C-terminal domain-containing protein n=1 Tax=Periweissella beninensis TaxID=504936 RepID=A0ABT0VJY3_9LACO|nr:hypothetical protein [Periweissella beninensis]MCM2437971.1 hypothetical protein [Periweissella beninensis]MCT4397037.1 hypothetical protein [Periweissella beninensis]
MLLYYLCYYIIYAIILFFIVYYFFTNDNIYLILAIIFLVSSNFSDNLIEVLTEPKIRSMTDEEQQVIKAMILVNEKDVVVIKKIREYTNLGLLQVKKVYEKIKHGL